MKQTSKKLVYVIGCLVCSPLSEAETAELHEARVRYITHSGIGTNFNSTPYPPRSLIALEVESSDTRILKSGGVSIGSRVLLTGYTSPFSIYNYFKSLHPKSSLSGTIIAPWPQQYLTYGDYLLQLLPEICLIKDQIGEAEWNKSTVVLPHASVGFVKASLKSLGLRDEQLLDCSRNAFSVEKGSQILFRQKDDYSFLCVPKELVDKTRNAYAHLMDLEGERRLLYIKRTTGYRRDVNYTVDVEQKLEEMGFTCIEAGDLSFEDQIRYFSSARMVVGVHGAGFSNIMWCQEDAYMMEVFHPKFALNCFWVLANHVGMSHESYGVAPDSDPNILYRESDVEIDWDAFLPVIADRMKRLGIV